MKIERIIGEGPETVYAWYFPSQVRPGSFPHRVGRTKGDPVARIRNEVSAAQEEPVIGTLIRTSNSRLVEMQIRLYCADRSIQPSDTGWFDVHPNAFANALEDLEYLPWYDQLHLARLREGLTQARLAAFCRLKQKTISQIESGRDVKMSSVTRVCRQLAHRVVIAFSDD